MSSSYTMYLAPLTLVASLVDELVSISNGINCIVKILIYAFFFRAVPWFLYFYSHWKDIFIQGSSSMEKKRRDSLVN